MKNYEIKIYYMCLLLSLIRIFYNIIVYYLPKARAFVEYCCPHADTFLCVSIIFVITLPKSFCNSSIDGIIMIFGICKTKYVIMIGISCSTAISLTNTLKHNLYINLFFVSYFTFIIYLK